MHLTPLQMASSQQSPNDVLGRRHLRGNIVTTSWKCEIRRAFYYIALSAAAVVWHIKSYWRKDGFSRRVYRNVAIIIIEHTAPLGMPFISSWSPSYLDSSCDVQAAHITGFVSISFLHQLANGTGNQDACKHSWIKPASKTVSRPIGVGHTQRKNFSPYG